MNTQRHSLLDRFCIFCAQGFGLGRAPFAPGSFGSLAGLPLGVWLRSLAMSAADSGSTLSSVAAGYLVLMLSLCTLFALWTIARTEAALGSHDDSSTVIDEVVGQAIAVAFVAPGWLELGLGYALFRFFDILKPLGVGWLDRHGPGAIGTLADDVLAGVYAALVLALIAGQWL